MKVISLLQPWASLAAMGIKKIETRSWNTNHRGIILIHASKGKAGEIFAPEKPFSKYIPDFKKLPFGAIIGSAVLTDCIRIDSIKINDTDFDSLTLEGKTFGNYISGFAWLLDDNKQFKNFYGAKGSLHLWNCPLKTEQAILKNEFGDII